MRSKQIHFFALREDRLPVLEAVERDGALKYVRTGVFGSPVFESVSRGADIRELGTATADSTAACECFLVTGKAVPVTVRPVKMDDGTDRYAIDQLMNPDSVAFTPGGVWNREIILHGRVGTVSNTAVSQELMRRFQSAFRTQFTKVQAFFVGPRALALLNAGKRLTSSARSPDEFDLRPVE